MSPRLAAGVEARALLRRVGGEGGFGTILAKGDEERGSILLHLLEKGAHRGFLERRLELDGNYRWGCVGPDENAESAKIKDFAERRRVNDPDLWLIELDVADGERFVAEMIDLP
ncbi:DUF1491 family protein [Sphingomicrobium nitratireducens]|uniref:DUF1491 family protein n=1 Tax=Sphingomicrobium nitratireducens TaxID=2964666 RepID=UPI00223F7E03|nr:DUF1491 family protein [Sphingomicrobium nitratireducens]